MTEPEAIDRGAASAPEGSSPLLLSGAALVAALLLATVVSRSFDADAFNHDVAQILYFAERMLDGARLYVDLIDENLPFIFWLSTAPVALARALGTTPILVFNLLVATLAFASAALCYLILRRAWPSSPPGYAVALLGLLLCVELLAPGYDYGQRDCLLVVAAMPYLHVAAARSARRPVPFAAAVAAGALASVGIALKPYFVALWIAVEAWLLARGRVRWRRAESLSIVAGGTLCLLLIVAFAREYVTFMSSSYGLLGVYYEADLLSVVLSPEIRLVLAAAGLLCVARASALDRELRQVLLVAMLALSAIAIAQGKGWSYHYYPPKALALYLFGVVALGLVAHGNALRDVLAPRASALPLIAIVLLSLWALRALEQAVSEAFGAGRDKPSMIRVLADVVEKRAFGRPIYLMSTSVAPAFPVVNLTGSPWASRFCCLFYLAGSYTLEEKARKPFPYHDLDEMGPLERWALDAVIEDMETFRPELLIVDVSPRKQGFGESEFQYLQYFRRDPRFERIFASYRSSGTLGKYLLFERTVSR